MWGPEEQSEPDELAETPPGAGIHRAGDHVGRARLHDDERRNRDAGGEDAAEADERKAATARSERGGERRDEHRRGQRDRPRRVPEPRLCDAQSSDGEGAEATPTPAPLARHRSRAARARTAPSSGGASTPSGPNDHQWLAGARTTRDVAATAIPGRAPRRTSQSGSNTATMATGNHQMAAKTIESGRTAAALAATASQWRRADGTSRAVGATSATSGNASGEATRRSRAT